MGRSLGLRSTWLERFSHPVLTTGSPELAHLNRIPNGVSQLVVSPAPVIDDGAMIHTFPFCCVH
ncbi:hypothetical protein PAXRUDRAFT_569099 [Paxillus rubicundulus Ve08.2h10]|uniref:Uncharacterized protein n=1 Tax=Paxillus rubicundulus Ve08.2h10 TaxID=930991 RepID=A0A0D0DVV4_9AGAM|nr:hypothetical protein PAXRUDRAFT_569099 [Paxillus rubicundulus Ve08.2h10]